MTLACLEHLHDRHHGNLAHALLHGAGRDDAVALRFPHGARSYAELAAATSRLAARFRRLGVQGGDRVLLALYDTEPLVVAWLAALSLGAIPAIVNPRLRADSIAAIVQDTTPVLVAVEDDRVADLSAVAGLPALRLAAQRPQRDFTLTLSGLLAGEGADDDAAVAPVAMPVGAVACLQFTSGTTGRPRAVPHTAAGLLASAALYAQDTLGLCRDDVVYSATRLFFGYGQGAGLVFPMAVGASSVIDPDWPSPDGVREILTRERPSAFFGVPALYAGLLETIRTGHTACLRIACSAGSALPAPLFEAWRARFGIEILDGIGATETAHIFVSNRPGDAHPGTTGRALPGYAVRLVDEAGESVPEGTIGRLLVRGPSVAAGYWQDAEATARRFHDGWYDTGDLFCDGEDGLRHCGRADDRFKINGRWVSPAEVENRILTRLPWIKGAILVPCDGADGLPQPTLAICVDTSTKAASDPHGAVIAALVGDVDSYKLPRRTVVMDAFPVNDNGKVLRREIARSCAS